MNFVASEDDVILWKKCLSGDKPAWDTLVKRYSKLVYKTIWDKLKQSSNPRGIEANDVYQDVYLKIFEKLDQWKREASLATWIRVIAARTTIDHLRRQKPLESLPDESADEKDTPQDEYGFPGGQSANPGERIFLNKLLTKLNPTELIVIKLNFLEEWSLEEVAEFLNKKVGTIYTTKSRALTKLRKICNSSGPM